MRRHSSIQLLLLSLTGCSWMLLFLTLTLSDYHAFKTYHASHVAAAQSTHTTSPKELDPCDLCWDVGKYDPKLEQQAGSLGNEASGLGAWGARLARVVGMGGNGQLNATPTPLSPPPGNAGGVGAFYYYTLHTTFTSLQVRLKKAQMVAGDVQTEVETLGEKVAKLHDTLINHFSPRMNPYNSYMAYIRPSTVQPPKKTKGTEDHLERPRASASSPTLIKSKNVTAKVQLESTTTKQPIVPFKDVYAHLHDQSQVVYPDLPPPEVSKPRKVSYMDNYYKDNYKGQIYPKVKNDYLFHGGRQILSYDSKNIDHEPKFIGKSSYELQINETNSIFDKKYRKVKVEIEDSEEIKCYSTIEGIILPFAVRDKFLGIVTDDVARSVSLVVMDQGKGVSDSLATLTRLYPGITVHLLTPSSLPPYLPHNRVRLFLHHVMANTSLSAAYRMAIDHVTTPYVVIATNISGLTSSTSLKHLVWAAERLGVWAVSGSLLTPSGRWHLGCLEIESAHYKVTWKRRKIGTAEGCSLCHSLEGPFLAVTSTLRDLSWDADLPPSVAQLDLFLRASQTHHMLAAVCPQDVLNITHEMVPPSRVSLLGLARRHNYYSLTVPGGVHVQVSCDEMSVNCGVYGLALPPCCRQELAQLVRFLMDTCDAHRLLCELQEGTLLGALKTGGVMPWERDADITFHTSNFTALGELKDVFDRAGYRLNLVDNRWCCVDGRWAGGQGTLSSAHWSLELYSQHAMDSEDDLLAGRSRTRVQFDGSWVTAPSSPGLYARNRYGSELYRHAQHWLDTGHKSGWEDYEAGKFMPCSRPSHHACLDQYPTDGNLRVRPLCLA